MAYCLEPGEDQPYLDPEEVIVRLGEEFSYMEADRDEGNNSVGNKIAILIELNAPQEIIDNEIAAQGRAIAVAVADDSTSDVYLRFDVLPDQRIFIGQSLDEGEYTLVERCAKALNYRVELV